MQTTAMRPHVGWIYGVICYVIWGIAPIYFKQLAHIPAQELLSHRILWSVVFLLILIVIWNRWHLLQKILRQPKKFALLVVSALLIGCNWLTYIWAINTDQILDASLGYYITPLMLVLFGVVLLKESLSKIQKWAVGLAVIGVLIQIFLLDNLPWIAGVLAISFGLYSLIRKYAQIDAISGLMIETLVLLPFAIYLLFGVETHTGALHENNWLLNLLLFSAGVITTLPLVFYAEATFYIGLSTLGFLQYISPSLMWILAVFVYHEPVTIYTLISFAFIWASLGCYSLESLSKRRKKRTQTA